MASGVNPALKVLVGPFGTNKVWIAGVESSTSPVLFFVGDQVESKEIAPEVYTIGTPKNQMETLLEKYPGSSIMVVMPSRLEAGLACFDHFLEKTTRSGEPLGYVGHSLTASRQIESLLAEGGQNFANRQDGVKLLGFSKGGVVLNQILSEMGAIREMELGDSITEEDHEKVLSFLDSVREIHFLDVGLHCRGGYLTDPRSIKGVGKFDLRVVLHGTPRQWKDVRRPWVKDEKNRLKALLEEEGVEVHEKLYLENMPMGLEMHFKVVTAFDPDMPG